MAAARCQCAECVALDARVRLAAAEGDRLGDAFRARTASMEHVPGCGCGACRPAGAPVGARASDRPGNASCAEIAAGAGSAAANSRARRTSEDINAEIYGMPPYAGPGLKHGPGGTGRDGPCDVDCRKCALERQRDALPQVAAIDARNGPPRKTLTPAARARLDAVVDRYQPPTEECARCHVVGPVDVPCLGCAALEPATEVYGLEEWLRGGRVPRHYQPSSDPDRDPGAAGRAEPPCCARVGERWCTEPIGHKPPCVAPTREVETPRRKR